MTRHRFLNFAKSLLSGIKLNIVINELKHKKAKSQRDINKYTYVLQQLHEVFDKTFTSLRALARTCEIVLTDSEWNELRSDYTVEQDKLKKQRKYASICRR